MFKKIFICLFFFCPALLAMDSPKGANPLITPIKKRSSSTYREETPGSTAHNKRVVEKTVRDLEEGKAGLPSDGSRTGEKARRAGRKAFHKGIPARDFPKIYDRWLKQYVTIRNNSARGRAGEDSVVEAFGFQSNNTGTDVKVFEVTLPPIARKPRKRIVKTRPDGVSTKHKIMLEVKTFQPSTSVYSMNDQLRAQFQAAKEHGFKHYLVFVTSTNLVDGFPRPSRNVSRKSDQIRLYDGNGDLYRWVKIKQGKGYWVKAVTDPEEEGSSVKRKYQSPVIHSPFLEQRKKSRSRRMTP